MKSIYLYSELDLEHTGHYTPFTLLGVVLFIGVFLLFTLVAARGLPGWIGLVYLIAFVASLTYDILYINNKMPDGGVIFQRGFEGMNVEIRIDKNAIINGEIVDFSYWWENQRIHLELVYETGQTVVLHETILPWESIPKNWEYKAMNTSDDAIRFPTFKVREMVKLLTREFEMAKNNWY